MIVNYPFGHQPQKTDILPKKKSHHLIKNAANRGMSFEDDINQSNTYYAEKGLALINKRPTPINIVKVDYSAGARITDAYFEKQSTTDYNGVCNGHYIDFEAKSSHSKTSFPLVNITPHQFRHLEAVIAQGGIAFFLIQFVPLDEVYLLDAAFVLAWKKESPRHSIPLTQIREHGYAISLGYLPRIDYLPIIKKVYFL